MKNIMRKLMNGKTLKIYGLNKSLNLNGSGNLKKRTLSMVYWCWIGKRKERKHRAYLHRNRGANLYWCPKHGLLMSSTLKLEGVIEKQMTKAQYKKFVDNRK